MRRRATNWKVYSLSTPRLRVRVSASGARIVGIEAPDRAGVMANVALRFDDPRSYDGDVWYTGATIGRYANRIAGGLFPLDGEQVQVARNSAGHTLHGGPAGFDRKMWTAREEENAVALEHTSPDGDMGFPGELQAEVMYSIADATLRIDYRATTSKPTVVSLTNHVYFNLGGELSSHVLTLAASRYTPVDGELIPTGEIATVSGTTFDFRGGAPLEAGYDHNFVIDGEPGTLRLAARVREAKSGRVLTVATTEPGVQLFTGRHGAFCLETQHYPDSPNRPQFPSTVLRPGELWRSTTTLTFDTD